MSIGFAPFDRKLIVFDNINQQEYLYVVHLLTEN